MEVIVKPGEFSSLDIESFKFEIISYVKDEMKIQLMFEDEAVEVSSADIDSVEVIFWNNEAFVSKRGVPLKEN